MVGKLPVYFRRVDSTEGSWEDGLLGVALDPGFTTNKLVYIYHSPINSLKSENRLSRFVLEPDRLLLDSEEVLLRVPVDRSVPYHSGGSITFDNEGNLFLSVGDNTDMTSSVTFPPVDDRPGRLQWDAARTAANTADFRGKILRIRPSRKGAAYTIPTNNLFPMAEPKVLPEIFAMGCRNPIRLRFDQNTGMLYWAELGLAEQRAGPEAPSAGMDEVNATVSAGNFGWPFLIGDNRPFYRFDYEKKARRPPVVPDAPENISRNNSGLRELPAARSAVLWFPSTTLASESGGISGLCTGPVYHYDSELRSSHKLPIELDNTMFLYSWQSGAIFTAHLDIDGRLSSIARFAPGIKLLWPMDLEIGPDGCLYLIEFGTGNRGPQIVRLEYDEPRRPKA